MDDVLTLGNGSITPRIAWDSVLDDATITSGSSVSTDGEVDQVADWILYTFWLPTGGGTHYITCDLVGTPTVNSWAMAGHGASGLIGMDTWNGTTWVLHSEVVHAGDGSAVYLVGSAVATTKLRFRFATITHLSTLWAGTDMQLPEGVGNGWSDPVLAQRAETSPEVSRDGVYLGTSVERWMAKLSLDIKHVEATWCRDYWLPFLRTCSTQPFFLHWNNVEWPTSACLCTGNKFGGTQFSNNGFVDLNVTFDADPGTDQRLTPDDETPALLIEGRTGPLLLE